MTITILASTHTKGQQCLSVVRNQLTCLLISLLSLESRSACQASIRRLGCGSVYLHLLLFSQDKQLQSHAAMLHSFQQDLTALQQDAPDSRKSKARELEELRQREEYLQYEVCVCHHKRFGPSYNTQCISLTNSRGLVYK